MPRLSQHSILRYATAASMLDTQSRAVRALIKRDGKAAASRCAAPLGLPRMGHVRPTRTYATMEMPPVGGMSLFVRRFLNTSS